jgi:mRNA interferase MazF
MSFERGDIVSFDFSPTLGHEQSGFRPAVVVSRTLYNQKTDQLVVCPITSKSKPFPMRVALDGRTRTNGFVICEQVRTIDAIARNPKLVEKMPADLIQQVTDLVISIFDD